MFLMLLFYCIDAVNWNAGLWTTPGIPMVDLWGYWLFQCYVWSDGFSKKADRDLPVESDFTPGRSIVYACSVRAEMGHVDVVAADLFC